MTTTIDVRAPAACAAEELQEFARLVRYGFGAVHATLPGRVRAARLLAIHRRERGRLGAIAALKSPTLEYRADVFAKAAAGLDPTRYDHELGWVYVEPAERGRRLGSRLCEALVTRDPSVPLFATTREENTRMMRILEALRFRRVGRAYPRRNEVLVLYCR